MERSINLYRRPKEFHHFVARSFSDLVKFKKDNDKTAFNALLLKVLPEVKQYVRKRWQTALLKGLTDKGKYRTGDFVDQLFIEVYDHFDEVKNKHDLHPWLFKKADELLEDTLSEEEFDTFFFENIDNYSRREWQEMEEKFTTDGDGDLVMLEELDDISYRKHDYILDQVFVDDNQEFIARIENEIGAENIRKHTDMVLYHLPSPIRMDFELFNGHQFDVVEIAKIRKSTEQEVETLLEAACTSLRTSFLNRYVP